MSSSSPQPKREAFVAGARSLTRRGIRFKHQGRDPRPGKPWGIDCWGLLVVAAARAGLVCPDREGYSRHSSPGLMRDVLASDDFREVVGPQLGAIPLFQVAEERHHVGVLDVVERGWMLIHSQLSAGPCAHPWPQYAEPYARFGPPRYFLLRELAEE